MFRIGMSFEFESAHYLTNVPSSHKCSRMHGHNYVVEIEMASPELVNDFVIDYFDFAPIKDFVNKNWDHRILNDVVAFNTSVELLTQYLYQKFKPMFPLLSAVTIRETPSTYCTYSE